MSRKQEVLRLEQVSTKHKGVKILSDAQLNLFNGETIGLIGVNYSGKTALAGAACGFLPCTDGRIYFMEKRVEIQSIMQAHNLGICYIQKKSALVEKMTVLDNLILSPPDRNVFLGNKKKIENNVKEVLLIFDVKDIDIYADVETLNEYHRLVVEVCKAIMSGVKVIFMDNILSDISFSIKDKVNEILLKLQSMGISIVLIETKYRHLKQWCNRIFVMRAGRTVGVLDKGAEEDKIISLMIGKPAKPQFDAPNITAVRHEENELLAFNNVVTDMGLNNLSFTVYEREIAGVLSLGRESQLALEWLLEGDDKLRGGHMFFLKENISIRSTDEALKKGVVFIHEDDNTFPEASLEENILISAYKTTAGGPMLNEAELKYLSTELIAKYFSEYEVFPREPVGTREDWLFLKKTALCRGFATSPKLMIFVNPTLHNDFATKSSFYVDILSIKDYGISGLILSTDLEELLMLCDRIFVMQDGHIVEQHMVDEAGKAALEQKFSAFLKDG